MMDSLNSSQQRLLVEDDPPTTSRRAPDPLPTLPPPPPAPSMRTGAAYDAPRNVDLLVSGSDTVPEGTNTLSRSSSGGELEQQPAHGEGVAGATTSSPAPQLPRLNLPQPPSTLPPPPPPVPTMAIPAPQQNMLEHALSANDPFPSYGMAERLLDPLEVEKAAAAQEEPVPNPQLPDNTDVAVEKPAVIPSPAAAAVNMSQATTASSAATGPSESPARLLQFDGSSVNHSAGSARTENVVVGQSPDGGVYQEEGLLSSREPSAPATARFPTEPVAVENNSESLPPTHTTPQRQSLRRDPLDRQRDPSLHLTPQRQANTRTLLQQARERRDRRLARLHSLKDDIQAWEEEMMSMQEHEIPEAQHELVATLHRRNVLDRYFVPFQGSMPAPATPPPQVKKEGGEEGEEGQPPMEMSPTNAETPPGPPPMPPRMEAIRDGSLAGDELKVSLRPAVRNLKKAQKRRELVKLRDELRHGGGFAPTSNDNDDDEIAKKVRFSLPQLQEEARKTTESIDRCDSNVESLARQKAMAEAKAERMIEDRAPLEAATAAARANGAELSKHREELQSVVEQLEEARSHRQIILRDLPPLQDEEAKLTVELKATQDLNVLTEEELERVKIENAAMEEIQHMEEEHSTLVLATYRERLPLGRAEREAQIAAQSAKESEEQLAEAQQAHQCEQEKIQSLKEQVDATEASVTVSMSEINEGDPLLQHLQSVAASPPPKSQTVKTTDDMESKGMPSTTVDVSDAETMEEELLREVSTLQDRIMSLHEELRARPPTHDPFFYENVNMENATDVARLGGEEVIRYVVTMQRIEAQIVTLSGEISRVREQQEDFEQYGAVEQYHRMEDDLGHMQQSAAALRSEIAEMEKEMHQLDADEESMAQERVRLMDAQSSAESDVQHLQHEIDVLDEDEDLFVQRRNAHQKKKNAFLREEQDRQRDGPVERLNRRREEISLKKNRLMGRRHSSGGFSAEELDAAEAHRQQEEDEGEHDDRDMTVVIVEAVEAGETPLRGGGGGGSSFSDASATNNNGNRLRLREREIHVHAHDHVAHPFQPLVVEEDAVGDGQLTQRPPRNAGHFSFTTTRLLSSLLYDYVVPSVETLQTLWQKRRERAKRFAEHAKIDFSVI